MYQLINEYQFVNAFDEMDRSEDFSRAGRFALYEYLEDLAEDCGEKNGFQLDVIALCCDYTEYPTAWDAMKEYQPEDMPLVEDSEGMDLLEISEKSEMLALEWLKERTQVIEFDEGIIIQNF